MTRDGATTALSYLCTFMAMVVPANSFSGDAVHGSAFDRCVANAAGTYGYVECVERETKVQEGILNENYQRAMQNLSSDRKEQLREIQRIWKEYVDKKCSFFYHEKSGSGGLEDAVTCRLEEVTRRSRELQELF